MAGNGRVFSRGAVVSREDARMDHVTSVRPLRVDGGVETISKNIQEEDEEQVEVQEQLKIGEDEKSDSREAENPNVLMDPRAPTAREIAEAPGRTVAQVAHRLWCGVCVAGRARDRHHNMEKDRDEHLTEVVFEFGIVRTIGEKETQATSIVCERKLHFARSTTKKELFQAMTLIN